MEKFKRILSIFLALYLLNFAFKDIISEVSDPAQELSYSKTIQFISENKIESIELYSNDADAEIFLKGSQTRYTTNIPNEDVFCEFVQKNISEGNDLNIVKTKKPPIWLQVIAFILGIFYLHNGVSGKKREANNSANLLNFDINFNEKFVESEVLFSDVAGLWEEKEELKEIIDFLSNPDKYYDIGANIPRGVLLSGPPGTGKTILAKAVAGEAGVPFLAISGSEFDEKFVGVGASRVRSLFENARMNAPCIIFIDEIDAIGQKRTSNEERWSVQTINQLLSEMDGFDSDSDIIVIAATNRIESLDPALTRPGRFDRHIEITLPDVNERKEILSIHSENKKIMDDVDFSALAVNTVGFSGADLEKLLNEAAIIAIRKNQQVISKPNIDEALKKVAIGLQKKGRKISEKERKLVAYHEAGHALVCKFMTTQNNVKEVSIIPRGTAGGYTWHEIAEDRNYTSKKELAEELRVLLGGRAAEQIVLNDISTGASSDLQQATEIAKNMICVYGMNEEVGPISLVNTKNELLGPDTTSLIGKMIAKSVKEAEKDAVQILKENKPLLDEIANALLEKETISGDEVDKFFKKYQNNYTVNV